MGAAVRRRFERTCRLDEPIEDMVSASSGTVLGDVEVDFFQVTLCVLRQQRPRIASEAASLRAQAICHLPNRLEIPAFNLLAAERKNL